MNVLLINARPAKPQATEMEPLGLLYLSATLRRRGHECAVVQDDYFRGHSEEWLVDQVRRERIGLVGFTTFNLNAATALSLCRAVKERTDARTILGGPLASAVPELVLREGVDYVVRGEGENSLADLADALAAGRTEPPAGSGVCFRRGGEAVASSRAPRVQDLDALPFPDRRRLTAGRHHMIGFTSGLRDRRVHSMITSRGCPNSCEFCVSEMMWQKHWVRRSVGNVMAEIGEIVPPGRETLLAFVDEDMAVREDHAIPLCDAMAASGLRLKWFSGTHLSRLNDRLIDAFARSGCYALYLGLDSGSEEILSKVKKKLELREASEAIRRLARRNIYAVCGFIVGFPWDDETTMRDTYEFARRLPADLWVFNYLNPFPGTSLHETAVRAGWIDRDYFLAPPPKFIEPFIPTERLTKARLKRWYVRYHVGCYLSARYLGRRVALAVTRPRRTLGVALGMLNILAYMVQVIRFEARRRAAERRAGGAPGR